MVRQITVVLLGLLLYVLLTAAGGFLLYRLSNTWPEHSLGAIVRYLGDPLIALIVGAVVGALAKNRAGLLAFLSLMPMLVGTLASMRRLTSGQMLLMVMLVIIYLAIGIGVAASVARNRARSRV